MAAEGYTGLGNQRNIIKNSTLKSLSKEPATNWEETKSADLNTKDSLKVKAAEGADESSKFTQDKTPSFMDKLKKLGADVKDKVARQMPDFEAVKDAANIDGRIAKFQTADASMADYFVKNGTADMIDGLINLDAATLAKVGRFVATNPSILTKQGLLNFTKDYGKGYARELIDALGLPKNLIDCLTNNMLNEMSFGNSFGGHNLTMRSLIDKFLAKNKCAKAAAMDLDPTYFGSRNGSGPGGFLTQLANNALLNTMINGDPRNAEYWFRVGMSLNDNKTYMLKSASNSAYDRTYAFTRLHFISNYYVRPNTQVVITPQERALIYTPSANIIKNIVVKDEDRKEPTKALNTIVGGLSVVDDKWNKDDNGEVSYYKFQGNENVEEIVDLALTSETTKVVNVDASPSLQNNSFLAQVDGDTKQEYIEAIKNLREQESEAFMEIVNMAPKTKPGHFLYNGPLGYHIKLPEEAANEINKDVVKKSDIKIAPTYKQETKIEHSVDMSSLLDIAKEDPALMRILRGTVILEFKDNVYRLCEEQELCVNRILTSPVVKMNSKQRERFEFLKNLKISENTNVQETVFFDADVEAILTDKLSYLVSLTPEQKLIALNMIVAMSPAERIELNNAYDEIDLSGIYKTVIGHKHAMKLASLSTGEVPKSLTA